jgi:hypothetical protein
LVGPVCDVVVVDDEDVVEELKVVELDVVELEVVELVEVVELLPDTKPK